LALMAPTAISINIQNMIININTPNKGILMHNIATANHQVIVRDGRIWSMT